MDPKGDPKCFTLSPKNASWGSPGQQFCSPVAIYTKNSSHWLPKSRQNEPESLQNTFQKVTNSIHLNKVNQSQQRPLIQSNFTESARKQIKPCTQTHYKTLPLSRPSRMFVTLRIDLQLSNWKLCQILVRPRPLLEISDHHEMCKYVQ